MEALANVVTVVKSRSGKECHRFFHRFDSRLVCAMDLIERYEKTWWRMSSGRSLILSWLRSSSSSSSSIVEGLCFDGFLVRSFFLFVDLVSIDGFLCVLL